MSSNNQNLVGKVALVTGANRGIGLEVCRQLAQKGARVILTSRDERKGQEAKTLLTKSGLNVDFWVLDVQNDESVRHAREYVEGAFGRLDILINNAGILPDNTTPGIFSDRSILETDFDDILAAFQTNSLGVVRVCREFVPLMKKGGSGRIVNVSSMIAQLATMDSGSPAYRISKVALNAITRILADELKDHHILCNCVSPGWVKTDMGGPNANIPVDQGAAGIVDLACLPDGGATGQFFRNGQVIEW